MDGSPTGTRAESSPFVDFGRSTWAKLGREHPPAADRRGTRPGAQPRRRGRPRRGARGVPAVVAAAHAARPGGRAPLPRLSHVPRGDDRPHAVRHRGRGVGVGRQVDHGPAAAAAAGALAAAPPRGAGDHRRLPAPQRRAGPPWADGPQGFPGVLRPPCTAALRHRGEGRTRGGGRARVLPPGLRHRPRRAVRRPAPRHPAARGAQRAAAGAAAAGRQRSAGGERLHRLLGLRRRRDRRHPPLVRRAVPAPARDRVPRTGRRTSAATPRSTRPGAVARAESIWAEINGPNLERNIRPTRGRASLVLRKGPAHNVTGIRLRKV